MRLLPWILAVMWLAARYVARQFMSIENAQSFGVLSNILIIVILIFLAIYNKYKSVGAERPTYFEDFKYCMKVAMNYVIGAIAAILLYYGLLTRDIDDKRQSSMEAFAIAISTDDGLAQCKVQWPQYALKTREQILDSKRSDVETFLSVQVQVIGGLLALTMVSIVYALLAVFFWRSIVRKI
ncbi:MAG: hypothetical protein ACKVOR_01420 [Flavobacteriales bacterium]